MKLPSKKNKSTEKKVYSPEKTFPNFTTNQSAPLKETKGEVRERSTTLSGDLKFWKKKKKDGEKK